MSTNFSLFMRYSINAAINKTTQSDMWLPRGKTNIC